MENLDKKNIIFIFRSIYDNMERHKETLTKLDSELGDGDLGITMCKGFQAICNSFSKFENEDDIGNFIKQLGFIMSDAVPSTMGTLLSIGIIKSGNTILGRKVININDIERMLSAAADAISNYGKTKRGDKTILDSLYPALDELKKANIKKCSLKSGIKMALDGAREGAKNTKKMKSTIGKAAVYGNDSIGKQDPGATVAVIIFEGIFNFISAEDNP